MTSLLVLGGASAGFAADWIAFDNETATRLAVPPALGVNDPDEKSYAWGDLDRDGDVDLVVARKAPFLSTGKRQALLLLNENGILTDRSATFASASDVPGDSGFLTPTASRDAAVVDIDLDGWLDVITVATWSVGDPQHIGHPRIYRNLGCGSSCSSGPWLGLRHESVRIPALLSYTGEAGHNPNFGAVSTGDVTGDGYPDLWLSDLELEGVALPPNLDFNDRLLVNGGAASPGHFFDATSALAGAFDPPGAQDVPFDVSRFSPAAAIEDFDGDGGFDILKVNAGSAPTYVAIALNSTPPGLFDTYRAVPSFSTYAVSAADLDRDGDIDIVETDDGQDRYVLNQGNNAQGLPSFVSFVFSYAHAGTGPSTGDTGFGGTSVVADLDRDGWPDVLIPDIDVNLASCERRMAIYRNLRGSPAGPGLLEEQTSGTACGPFQGHPASCLVAGIPASELKGTHDVAVFDIDGDGWLDLVLGRCAGTRVFLQAPFRPAGSIPDGSGASEPLRLARGPHAELILTWGDSCLEGDADYAVYSGVLGSSFDGPQPVACTTSGARVTSVPMPAGSAYFLVVALSAEAEGSYGRDSAGNERWPSDDACLPQRIAVCD